MNEASLWRLEMAHKIAPVYADNPKVRAVMVSGSTARGCADRYSDIEIGVFWAELATEAEFATAKEQMGGAAWELDPYDPVELVWYEEYEVGGVKIDLRHMTLAHMDAVLTAVVDRYDTSEERQQIVSAVQRSVPLFGGALLERGRAKAARYPDGLARAMVRKHLALNPWWSVPMLAERGDLPLVYGAFNEAAEAILGALMGLNRLYHPGSKWMNRIIGEMRLTPPALADRLRQVFLIEPLAGAAEMQRLVEETFDLVEREMPGANVAAARAQFLYRRATADGPPEGWL